MKPTTRLGTSCTGSWSTSCERWGLRNGGKVAHAFTHRDGVGDCLRTGGTTRRPRARGRARTDAPRLVQERAPCRERPRARGAASPPTRSQLQARPAQRRAGFCPGARRRTSQPRHAPARACKSKAHVFGGEYVCTQSQQLGDGRGVAASRRRVQRRFRRPPNPRRPRTHPCAPARPPRPNGPKARRGAARCGLAAQSCVRREADRALTLAHAARRTAVRASASAPSRNSAAMASTRPWSAARCSGV